MNSKIKTLLLLTIIITTIILHTEKTPIVYAYSQTNHNNLEYINWIYLKPISPKTEFDFTQMSFDEIQQYWGIANLHGPWWDDGATWEKVSNGLKVYTTAYRSGALIYSKFSIPEHLIYNGLTIEAHIILNSGTKRLHLAPQLVHPYNIKAGTSILNGDNYGYTTSIFFMYGGYTDGYRNSGIWYATSVTSTRFTFKAFPFYPRVGVEYCIRTTYYYDKVVTTFYDKTCSNKFVDIIYNVLPGFEGKYMQYYVSSNGVTKFDDSVYPINDLRIVIGVADDYAKTGFIIKSLRVYTKQRTIDTDLVKPPDIIELKNGGFTKIQYTIYTHQIIINNPNNNDLIDYQVKIPITYSDVGDSFIWGVVGSIRIYDQNGQELPYWVESWDSDTKDAVVWVKVPKIPAGGSITLTLESSFKYSDKSDGYAVFDFFDGFETWEGWVKYGSGVVSQSSGQARGGTYSAKKYAYADPNGAYKSLGFTLNYPFVLEAWVNRVYFSGANADRIGVIDDNGNGYGFVADMNRPVIGIDKRSSYRGTTYSILSISQSVTNNWYFVRFIWNNGNMKAEVYYNGELLGSTTYTDTAYSSFTRVYIFGGYTYYVDDLRIRKYADVEPTVKIVS